MHRNCGLPVCWPSTYRNTVFPVRPHQIQYYLERRDPDFEVKMLEVLHVYKDVAVWRKAGLPSEVFGVLSSGRGSHSHCS